MPWVLSQVTWLVREGDQVAILPWAATCSGCQGRTKGGLTACCGLPICLNCIYGSRPTVCPLCAEEV